MSRHPFLLESSTPWSENRAWLWRSLLYRKQFVRADSFLRLGKTFRTSRFFDAFKSVPTYRTNLNFQRTKTPKLTGGESKMEGGRSLNESVRIDSPLFQDGSYSRRSMLPCVSSVSHLYNRILLICYVRNKRHWKTRGNVRLKSIGGIFRQVPCDRYLRKPRNVKENADI